MASASEVANMGPPTEDSKGDLEARFSKFGFKDPRVRTDLYPPIEPYRTGTLSVSDLHTLYWEECGNPEGQVTFLLCCQDLYE